MTLSRAAVALLGRAAAQRIRHLHVRATDTHALCHVRLKTRPKKGRAFGDRILSSVHYSKARKTDCRTCRVAYRFAISPSRRKRELVKVGGFDPIVGFEQVGPTYTATYAYRDGRTGKTAPMPTTMPKGSE